MRKNFVALACLVSLSVTPALSLTREADFIRQYRAKAVECQFQNNYDQAIDYYKEALKIAAQSYGNDSPFLSEIYYEMGVLALTNSQFKNAEDWLNMAAKLNPNSAGAHLKLAELELVKGQADEAVKQAALVVAKHKDDVVAHQQLAIALERSDQGMRSFREFATTEQLVRLEKMRYDGLAPQAKLTLTNPVRPAVVKPASVDPGAAAKKAAEAKAAEDEKKAAAAAAKKAADDAKRMRDELAKQDNARKEASKKAADAQKKADAAKRAAEAKKAADAAKAAKKSMPKKAPEEGLAAEPKSLNGMPAALRSKAVLLTPVGKKPASAESVEKIKPMARMEPKVDESGDTDEPPAPKKPVKTAEPKMQPAVIKPIKPMKGGLVPPPPPVIPTMQMMVPPPQAAMPPKPKQVKKVEAPKVEPAKEDKAPASSGGAEDDDFLLDWGGAKKKK